MGTTQPGADAPIGIFDSGVGGLTVARAVLDQLPGEAIRYIGDTANGPYGPLPIAEVRRHSLAVMDGLVADGVKMLVVACNSASAASLRDSRERYDVPVVEVIRPAVRFVEPSGSMSRRLLIPSRTSHRLTVASDTRWPVRVSSR